MGKAVKIAISLPEQLLEAAESERHVTGETRSEFFRRAVETLLRRERQREAFERYVQAYREEPETEEEVAAIHQLGSGTLAREPWE